MKVWCGKENRLHSLCLNPQRDNALAFENYYKRHRCVSSISSIILSYNLQWNPPLVVLIFLFILCFVFYYLTFCIECVQSLSHICDCYFFISLVALMREC
ncbi:hypothetical protein EGW08_012948 [Elysia chlorotica]|uniref:Uncharacterized protein n=1 Tax=Elysia chlorotica TaxID=188477 RepID=A0A3S0ZNV7_ELYCH|nr:hypothetical protein EGW08_012948 [Elysia chlorotica]